MDFFRTIGRGFSQIWASYFGFMTNTFGQGVAIGLTIVIGFALASLIFFLIINSLNDR